MKIVNKPFQETANISSARGMAFNEFWKLIVSAIILLVVLFFSTGFVVDFFVGHISVETEASLFNVFPQTGAKTKPAYEASFKRVNKILGILIKNPRIPNLPYTIRILEHEDPNAFAFPGGVIGITSGLLAVLSDDIEIAFVIGHELGHFSNRDHLRGMGRAISFSILTAVIFGNTVGASRFGKIMHLAMARRYSQEREKKADQIGLQLVHETYGETGGTRRLFDIVSGQEKIPGWAYMFATHPSPAERIRQLEKYAAEL
jgi:Zn-dependent protease with chaperone function